MTSGQTSAQSEWWSSSLSYQTRLYWSSWRTEQPETPGGRFREKMAGRGKKTGHRGIKYILNGVKQSSSWHILVTQTGVAKLALGWVTCPFVLGQFITDSNSTVWHQHKGFKQVFMVQYEECGTEFISVSYDIFWNVACIPYIWQGTA